MKRVLFVFRGNLQELLRVRPNSDGMVEYLLDRRASVKDVVESLGIPHTEIARLTSNENEITFSYILRGGDTIKVEPLVPPYDVFSATALRPQPLAAIRFVVDVNVGKLASLLRMLGFDTVYRNPASDALLAKISEEERRVLLTKDTHLLKRKNVVFGHLVRETTPKKQLVEIVRLFQLEEKINPFARCLECNGELVPVAKENILDRLEPLTRKYYNSFHRCPGCDKIYWPGSHRQRLEEDYARLLGRTGNSSGHP